MQISWPTLIAAAITLLWFQALCRGASNPRSALPVHKARRGLRVPLARLVLRVHKDHQGRLEGKVFPVRSRQGAASASRCAYGAIAWAEQSVALAADCR